MYVYLRNSADYIEENNSCSDEYSLIIERIEWESRMRSLSFVEFMVLKIRHILQFSGKLIKFFF